MKMKSKGKTKTPLAAAIYCRISLDRSGDGLGVDRQEQLCRKLAADRGWPVAEVYRDNDRSAYTGKPRSEYTRMLADIETGVIDAVLCVDLDRLTRRPVELEAFMELADRQGVALANVSGDTDLSTSDGRFKARIMGAVARQESEKKGERMRREAEHAARRGVPRGSRRAFGYEVDRVTVREPEAVLIREAVQRMLDGGSAASVARDWNDRGIPSPQAATHGWSGSSVVGVLRNPRIMGARAYKGEILAEDAWPAIIDRDKFERLQAKIRRGSRPGRSAKRLLSAIARCGRCGGPLWNSHRRDNGHRVTRYVCVKRPGAPGCGATTVVADKLDQLLIEAVLHRLQSPAMTRALLAKPNNKNGVDIDLSRIERELEDLAADYGNGAISRREWLAARKPLEERRDRARRDIDHTNGTVALAQFRGMDVRERWAQLDIDRQRAVLDALIDRVTVRPSTTPGRFNPDRVEVEWRM
jgi:DNA invertase Pin-like site-specific DNA recombinase